MKNEFAPSEAFVLERSRFALKRWIEWGGPSIHRVLADYVSFFHTISCLEASTEGFTNDATKNGDDARDVAHHRRSRSRSRNCENNWCDKQLLTSHHPLFLSSRSRGAGILRDGPYRPGPAPCDGHTAIFALHLHQGRGRVRTFCDLPIGSFEER